AGAGRRGDTARGPYRWPDAGSRTERGASGQPIGQHQSMSSRYVPYATTPARLLVQLVSDAVVLIWTAIWVFVGIAVYDAVAAVAEFGGQVNTGATGIAHNLDSAGSNASQWPLIGGALSSSLSGAAGAARDIAGAGHN